ncbi:hypothetical protein EDD22DRAFT_1042520 [Suillus occidentalis]|nr:hypothetical protein EDD22DRAFT_1042520 [Suillus occidentalis]
MDTERCDDLDDHDHSKYLALPSADEIKKCFCAFRAATSNSALAMSICIVCARELMSHEGEQRVLDGIPNLKRWLTIPANSMPASASLWEGMLMLEGHVKGDASDATDARRGRDPSHLQHGMAGNATLYDMNTNDVAKMIEGQFLPQPINTLASILAITYIGKRGLPKEWLKSTFRVRRAVVFNALKWLKANNPLYGDIQISQDLLARLPEDEVPEEIISIVRHEVNDDIAVRESEGYVPDDHQNWDDDASVIPLHYLGITDTQLCKLPLNDLMKHALTNLGDPANNEGGYAVRHSGLPVSDFGRNPGGEESKRINPLAATYPKLFPYGIGGIEATRTKYVGFDEHIRWALQYHDRRFRTHHSFPFVVFGISQKRKALQSARIQMRRKDFERDAFVIKSLTVADLKQAEKEEAENKQISNPRVRLLRKHVFATSSRVLGSDNFRAQYRGRIWGTLWVTVNPIFAGESINLDDFFPAAGPDSNRRACNIARDPFAATKYFFFIINAVLTHLFQVNATTQRVNSGMGMLGHIKGYFGVVEAQGRGTLHVHMMIWLRHTPNTVNMHKLLQDEEFRARVQLYIQQNIRAHIDGLDEESIRTTPKESHVPYSRPPNPDSDTWEMENNAIEHRVVRSQQVHTCSRATCLRFNKHGQLVCKRRAPWPLSPVDVVDEHGRWSPKRTYAFLNNYCPAITLTLRCNNDIKLLTNGRETKDAVWYLTDYSTKKQNKNNNVSALMANALLYHEGHSNHLNNVLDCNRLLLFRCQHSINREMELSGPQVISYLMNWGDVISSHHYEPLYWFALRQHLLQAFPHLSITSKSQ